MLFEVALAAARGDRRKIRLPEWPKGNYLYFKESWCWFAEGQCGSNRLNLTPDDLMSERWEFYEPGHPFQWAVRELLIGRDVRREGVMRTWRQRDAQHTFTTDDMAAKDWMPA